MAVCAAELTSRELAVLVGVGKGMADKEIGRRLCISEGTVAYHLTQAFDKLRLDVRTRARAWAVALRRGYDVDNWPSD